MQTTDYNWEEFKNLSMPEKVVCFSRGDSTPFHTLFSQQFNRTNLDHLCSLATQIRTIAKTRNGMNFLRGLLPHKRAMLYFTQPSSRTFLSFLSACQIIGLNVGEVRDTAISSEYKGETREDSIRTFSSYFDIIIMRSRQKGLAEHMAWTLSNSERPIPIINAGSGQDQHPTQALLDIYTLKRSFERRGGLRDKTVMFVGDLARGRTVRSLSDLLLNYNNIRLVFIAPEPMQISEDVCNSLSSHGVDWIASSDMHKYLPEVDAIYMTRIQDEWDVVKGESAKIDTSRFKIGLDEMRICKPDAILMHPLPRRDEIAKEVDHDPRAMYWRQMRNGMWIRAALIASTFDCAERVNEFYRENI
jgi:aspartate carbamoyltransferase catalytic subunit